MLLDPYFDFIESCKLKIVENKCIHKHHIIPRHIFKLKDLQWIDLFKTYIDVSDMNDESNFISLIPEDHFEAHHLLSNLFEKVHRNIYNANVSACHHLLKELNMSEIQRIQYRLDFVERIHSLESRLKRGKSLKNTKLSEKHKNKISQGLNKFHEINFKLPEGIFQCDEIINGRRKLYFRICPNVECQSKMYYGDVDRFDIYQAHRKNKICRKCSATKVSVIDVETGEVFKSKKDIKSKYNFSISELSRLIESGKFIEIIDEKYQINIDKLKKPRIRKTKGKEQSCARRVKLLETGEIFETVREFIKQKNIPYCRYKKMKDNGQILVDCWADIIKSGEVF